MTVGRGAMATVLHEAFSQDANVHVAREALREFVRVQQSTYRASELEKLDLAASAAAQRLPASQALDCVRFLLVWVSSFDHPALVVEFWDAAVGLTPHQKRKFKKVVQEWQAIIKNNNVGMMGDPDYASLSQAFAQTFQREMRE